MNPQAQRTTKTVRYISTSRSQVLEPQLNAENLFAAGILKTIQNRFDEAMRYFQRACTFIPDQFGVSEWFAGYLLEETGQRNYNRHLLIRIYENLGKCLVALGRMDDARFVLNALPELDPGFVSPDWLSQQIDSRRSFSQPHAVNNQKGVKAIPAPAPSLGKSMTVLMLTHYTDKLKVNRHLAPPSPGLVQTTYESMLNVFGPSLLECRRRLIFDRKTAAGELENEYQNNLAGFASDQGFDLKIQHCSGLQRCLSDAMKDIATPFVFVVEHDWEFLPPAVDLYRLIRIFNRHRGVNLIRFNKRKNAIAGFDFIMERASDIDELELIRTAAFSNNPHLARVKKMRQDWLPICLADRVSKQYDLSSSAFGIEEPLFKNFLQDIRRDGFTKAHAHWGTYVYGQINAQPKIRHLGY